MNYFKYLFFYLFFVLFNYNGLEEKFYNYYFNENNKKNIDNDLKETSMSFKSEKKFLQDLNESRSNKKYIFNPFIWNYHSKYNEFNDLEDQTFSARKRKTFFENDRYKKFGNQKYDHTFSHDTMSFLTGTGYMYFIKKIFRK